MSKLFFHQLRNSASSITRLYLIPVAILVAVIALIGHRVSDYVLFADPTEIANQPPYVGFFSRLGNLLWCATASICLFGAAAVRNKSPEMKKYSLFLVCSGLLIGVFLLDDYFDLVSTTATR